ANRSRSPNMQGHRGRQQDGKSGAAHELIPIQATQQTGRYSPMADGQTLGPGIFEAGLLAALDSPQLVKFPAGYHEAYWFYGYDEHHSIGYYFYLVADTASDTLRHEQTYIFLADGSILADHGSGHGTTDGVARGDKL